MITRMYDYIYHDEEGGATSPLTSLDAYPAPSPTTLREIIGLLSRIFVRVGFDRRSL